MADGPTEPQVDRRRLLQVGGVGLGAAFLSACSTTSHPGPRSATTTIDAAAAHDVALLRLTSSIEHFAVAVYGQVAASGLVKTLAISDAARHFSDQHAAAAAFFEEATSKRHGQPFTTANPAVVQQFADRISAMSNEGDIAKLAYDVEAMGVATCYSVVGSFDNAKLNAAVMSVGAIEARHVAVLGMYLSGLPVALPTVAVRGDAPPYPSGALLTSNGAIAPGTGV